MTIKAYLIILVVLSTIFSSVNSEENDFIVEILSPRGFRVSTKNTPGIQRVGFRGNINVKLLRHEHAEYTADFALQSNDLWVYENPTILNPGDTLYYRPLKLSRTTGVEHFNRQFYVPIETPSIHISESPTPLTETPELRTPSIYAPESRIPFIYTPELTIPSNYNPESIIPFDYTPESTTPLNDISESTTQSTNIFELTTPSTVTTESTYPSWFSIW